MHPIQRAILAPWHISVSGLPAGYLVGLRLRLAFGFNLYKLKVIMGEAYEKYSNLTQDELLTEIGRMLMAGAIHGQPVNDEEYRRFGENWFLAFRRMVKPIVCKPEVLAQLRGSNKDRNTVIGLLINMFLAADLHCPIPVGSLAVALINYGTGGLCDES